MTIKKAIFYISAFTHPLVGGMVFVLGYYAFFAPDQDFSPWLILWILIHTIVHCYFLEERWFEG